MADLLIAAASLRHIVAVAEATKVIPILKVTNMKRNSKPRAVIRGDAGAAHLRKLAQQAEEAAAAAKSKAREAKAKLKQAKQEAKKLRGAARKAKKDWRKAVLVAEKAESHTTSTKARKKSPRKASGSRSSPSPNPESAKAGTAPPSRGELAAAPRSKPADG